MEAVLEKKERSSKGKARDEQKELRREKKQGRKRVIMFLSFNNRIRSLHISHLIQNIYIKLYIKILNYILNNQLTQDRAEESIATTEQKRRKDDERGSYNYIFLLL